MAETENKNAELPEELSQKSSKKSSKKFSKGKKALFLFIKLLITSFCIFHLVKTFGHEISLVQGSVKLSFIFLGFGLFALSQLVAVWRWKACCKKLGVLDDSKGFCRVTFFLMLKHYFAGLLCNNFLPGSAGGDLVRAYLLKTNTEDSQWSLCVGSVLVDRTFGLLGMSCIALIISIIIKTQTTLVLSNTIVYGIAALCLLSFSFIVFALVSSKFLPSFPVKSLEEEEEMGIKDKMLLQLSEFAEALSKIKNDKRALLFLISTSFLIQALIGSCLISLAKGLDLKINALYLWIVNPLVTVGSLIAPSINGLGVRENIYAYFFQSIGEQGGEGVVLSACWLLTLLIVSLPGLIFILQKKGLNRD